MRGHCVESRVECVKFGEGEISQQALRDVDTRGQGGELDRGQTYAPKFSGAMRRNITRNRKWCKKAQNVPLPALRPGDSPPDFPTHIKYVSTAFFFHLASRHDHGNTEITQTRAQHEQQMSQRVAHTERLTRPWAGPGHFLPCTHSRWLTAQWPVPVCCASAGGA